MGPDPPDVLKGASSRHGRTPLPGQYPTERRNQATGAGGAKAFQSLRFGGPSLF